MAKLPQRRNDRTTRDQIRAMRVTAEMPFGELGTFTIDRLQTARRGLLQLEAPPHLIEQLDRLIADVVQLLTRDETRP
jgi:hypothetical protein